MIPCHGMRIAEKPTLYWTRWDMFLPDPLPPNTTGMATSSLLNKVRGSRVGVKHRAHGGDFLKDLPLEWHNFLNCLAENHQKDGQFDVVRSSLVKDKLDLREKITKFA